MPPSMLFEDFSVQQNASGDTNPTEGNSSDANRASFEDGYKEGWIDAQAAAQDETSELNSEIATALQEAGFAYFEARQHIFNSMRPLLEAMIDQVVPALARDVLPQKIVEEVLSHAADNEPPMHILCAPDIAKPLGDVLARHVTFPIDVKTEVTLTETQAVLKFAESEATIDLGAIVSGMKTALADFYDLNNTTERSSHG